MMVVVGAGDNDANTSVHLIQLNYKVVVLPPAFLPLLKFNNMIDGSYTIVVETI